MKNIGYYLTGSTGYANSPNLTNPQWIGVGNVAASNIIFTSTGPNTLTLLLHKTGNADEFGVFNAANPSQITPLFTTATPEGTTASFTSPYSTYGFYLHYLPSSNPAIPNDYYKSTTSASIGTESTSSAAGHQHFSVFAGTGGISSQNFIVGGDDGWGTNTVITINNVSTNEKIGDFQDFVVALNVVTLTPVPEPASIGFMVAGLAGLLALRSRKKVS